MSGHPLDGYSVGQILITAGLVLIGLGIICLLGAVIGFTAENAHFL
jgi:hypothetical protein